MTGRVSGFSELLKSQYPEFQAALITSEVNRYYLTGLPSSAGVLLVTPEYSCLFVDFRYYEKAKRVVSGADVEMLTNTAQQLGIAFEKHKINTVCVESGMTLGEYFRFKESLDVKIDCKTDITSVLESMRSIKDSSEIENIKEAQKIAETAFEKTLSCIKRGTTEKQIVCELEYNMKKSGSQRCAFETIGVSGKNSSLPHGVCSEKPLEEGDFLTLDFGAAVNGYLSDMTRTVHIGAVTGEEKVVYETVKMAQKLAFDKIKPGVKCCDVDKIARDYIYAAGYEGCFGHALGHSVGLEIHESPCFSSKDETILKPGMVVTVEPGIYLEGRFGVRIENMALITPDGCENLTAASSELLIL